MLQETRIRGEKSGITFVKRGIIDPEGLSRVHPVVAEGTEYSLKLPRVMGSRRDNTKLRYEYDVQTGLRHPNITPIVLFDTTRDLLPGISVPFLVTPQRDESLSHRIDTSLVIPVSQVISITDDIASALSFMHGKGIIHSDLTASNVLLQEQDGILHAELTDLEYAVIENEKRRHKKEPLPPELRKGKYVATSEQFDFARKIVYPMIFHSYIHDEFDPYYPLNPNAKEHLQRRPFSEAVPAHRMTEYHKALEGVAAIALQEQIHDRYTSMAVLLDDLRFQVGRARERATVQ